MKFGIFVYDDAEAIDLATFGTLSMARRVAPQLSMALVGPGGGTIRLANGLRVIADYAPEQAPRFDVLIVTGGPGWKAQAADAATLAYLRAAAPGTLLVSVCTGAMILAAAGLLGGRRATTKHEVVPPELAPLAHLAELDASVEPVRALLVDDGTVVSGGGVTLCIDTVLHLLETRLGKEVAHETARTMEYARAWRANRAALPTIDTTCNDEGQLQP